MRSFVCVEWRTAGGRRSKFARGKRRFSIRSTLGAFRDLPDMEEDELCRLFAATSGGLVGRSWMADGGGTAMCDNACLASNRVADRLCHKAPFRVSVLCLLDPGPAGPIYARAITATTPRCSFTIGPYILPTRGGKNCWTDPGGGKKKKRCDLNPEGKERKRPGGITQNTSKPDGRSRDPGGDTHSARGVGG